VWMGEGEAVDSVAVSLRVRSRSFAATRSMGEAGLAAAAADALRDVRQQQTRAMLVEGPETAEGSEIPDGQGGALATSSGGVAIESGGGGGREAGRGDTTPGFDVIGPTMLAAFGAAGVGLGIYALLDGTCERRGETVCLRGEEPSVPAGVTLTLAGALALGGAVFWLVTGASVVDTTRIDVVLGPDGGAAGVRGQF
jgi:hypothetical protein